MFRHWANRFLGHGPFRLAPFSTIVAARRDTTGAVHQPEQPLGTVASAPGESVTYALGPSLLGQPPAIEPLAGGPRYQANLSTQLPARELRTLTDAGVVGADGVVYCRRSRTAVLETVKQWTAPATSHPVLGAARLPKAKPLPGLTLSLGTLSGDGFYHFLLESLPALSLARPWLSRIDQVLANGRAGAFHQAWLAEAGIPAEKIIWLEGLSHYACETLLFAGELMPNYAPGHWHVAALREIFPTKRTSGGRRIFISRKQAASRGVQWEDALLAELPGIESVDLAALTPAEQRRTLADADAIIGPHGAGLANLVFCERGTKVVELFPSDAWMQPIYARLAGLVAAPYAWARVDFQRADACTALASAIRSFLSK